MLIPGSILAGIWRIHLNTENYLNHILTVSRLSVHGFMVGLSISSEQNMWKGWGQGNGWICIRNHTKPHGEKNTLCFIMFPQFRGFHSSPIRQVTSGIDVSPNWPKSTQTHSPSVPRSGARGAQHRTSPATLFRDRRRRVTLVSP